MKTETGINDWIYAAEESDLKEGGMIPAYPLGVNILLAKVDHSVYALSGKCVHMACPLYIGTLKGDVLTCPCHDWRYNVRTGEFLDTGELNLEKYELKSENGKLFVKMSKGKPS